MELKKPYLTMETCLHENEKDLGLSVPETDYD